MVGGAEQLDGPVPVASSAYLAALESARMIVVGAGSLFSSQLAQLGMQGVMDGLVQRRDIRKVLVLNHVCMNETNGYSLTDHIQAIERLARRATSKTSQQTIRIGDIFTDIIVPRTIAREIDMAIRKEPDSADKARARWDELGPDDPEFVTAEGGDSNRGEGIFRNSYVRYVLDHPDFRARHQITDWELRILGFLKQPHCLYRARSEAGRYRGAVYATEEDYQYLMRNGIPRRHIYEVECIAMNEKIMKCDDGKLREEQFPGLVSESLVGIFKILLEKGQCTLGQMANEEKEM